MGTEKAQAREDKREASIAGPSRLTPHPSIQGIVDRASLYTPRQIDGHWLPHVSQCGPIGVPQVHAFRRRRIFLVVVTLRRALLLTHICMYMYDMHGAIATPATHFKGNEPGPGIRFGASPVEVGCMGQALADGSQDKTWSCLTSRRGGTPTLRGCWCGT